MQSAREFLKEWGIINGNTLVCSSKLHEQPPPNPLPASAVFSVSYFGSDLIFRPDIPLSSKTWVTWSQLSLLGYCRLGEEEKLMTSIQDAVQKTY